MSVETPRATDGTAMRYDRLEIVRALAALAVVAGHVVLYDLIRGTATLHMLTAFATEAVIVFFILSGLVITLSTQRAGTIPRSPLAFLWRRLVRLYPIYLVALALAYGTQRVLGWDIGGLSLWVGNALFLQSLSGTIVATPLANPPLWSLAYEMTYYLLFAIVLAWRPFRHVWLVLALACAVIVSRGPIAGPIGHVFAILSLALPWLLGSAIARHADRLPRCSVPFGLCLAAIGLMFARSPLGDDFYDPFRLCSFALLCAPLLLAIVRPPATRYADPPMLRLAAFALGAALLWTISPALLLTKLVITAIGLLAAVVPLALVATALAGMRSLRRPLVYVGTISYALYAIHLPLLLLVKHAIPDSAVLRLAVFVPVLLLLSHGLERVLQPRIARALIGRR